MFGRSLYYITWVLGTFGLFVVPKKTVELHGLLVGGCEVYDQVGIVDVII